MTISRALYSQARDNASSSPVVADGVWLPDADTELRREVGSLIAGVKLSGRQIISTPDINVTEGLYGGILIEALCNEKDIANRSTYVVLYDRNGRSSREFFSSADVDLRSFAARLDLNISAGEIHNLQKSEKSISKKNRAIYLITFIALTSIAIGYGAIHHKEQNNSRVESNRK